MSALLHNNSSSGSDNYVSHDMQDLKKPQRNSLYHQNMCCIYLWLCVGWFRCDASAKNRFWQTVQNMKNQQECRNYTQNKEIIQIKYCPERCRQNRTGFRICLLSSTPDSTHHLISRDFSFPKRVCQIHKTPKSCCMSVQNSTLLNYQCYAKCDA